jgi:hypothetical protein
MAGLIGTGLGYQNTALSGFVRESEEQQKVDMANKQLKAQQDMQQQQTEASMIGSGLGIAMMLGMMLMSSDENLKDVLDYFDAGLLETLQINPIFYKWKGQTDDVVSVGVSAQNVQVVLPEAVKMTPEGNLAVDPLSLIALLINAIKDLNAKIDAINERNGG